MRPAYVQTHVVLLAHGAPARGPFEACRQQAPRPPSWRLQTASGRRRARVWIGPTAPWRWRGNGRPSAARARLRLEERQEAAAVELARRRRELAAGFVSLAPLAHREGRARLLLAGLAQSAAVAAARVDRLAAEGAALARLQRAAHAATALWTARRTAAVGRMGAAGMRWRRALRRYAASADSFSSGSKKIELGSGRLTSVDRVTLALGLNARVGAANASRGGSQARHPSRHAIGSAIVAGRLVAAHGALDRAPSGRRGGAHPTRAADCRDIARAIAQLGSPSSRASTRW